MRPPADEQDAALQLPPGVHVYGEGPEAALRRHVCVECSGAVEQDRYAEPLHGDMHVRIKAPPGSPRVSQLLVDRTFVHDGLPERSFELREEESNTQTLEAHEASTGRRSTTLLARQCPRARGAVSLSCHSRVWARRRRA